MAKFCMMFTVAVMAVALAAAEQPDALDHTAMTEGDECKTSEECALNALQRAGRMLEAGAAQDDDQADGEAGDSDLDIPPSEPDTMMYSNLSLGELGVDELRQLIEAANGALGERLAEPAEAPALAGVDEETLAAEATTCPMRMYTGRRSGSNLCFCQLAGNSGCANTRCACPQGCRGVAWSNGETVTFKNRARAHGCSPSTVLLTASRTYYATTRDLRHGCGGGATGLLTAMLANSWDHYQSKVGKGPVNQCFHNPNVASVKYLHLQTFCARGEFHAMPTGNSKNGVGFCVTMSSKGQAGSLASKLARWL